MHKGVKTLLHCNRKGQGENISRPVFFLYSTQVAKAQQGSWQGVRFIIRA